MQQGSEEWFRARAGKITASRIKDVMAKLKSGKPAATRKNYVSELVAERLSGQKQDSYTSAAMQWGIDTEPLAIEAYEADKLVQVQSVGFVPHPELDYAGASPDGIVGEGLVEVKCPNTATHIETLLHEKIDRPYILQMQWQMACTGRAWTDFCSFDPRLPGHELWIKRVERDDKLIEEITQEVKKLNDEVETIIKQLKR